MEPFELTPRPTKSIDAPFRRIRTWLPVPESVAVLEELRSLEPRSLASQLPVLWDRAEGVQVYDPYGNMWLDWTSGVLTANLGHSPPEIVEAITRQAHRSLLHAYLFPTVLRAEFGRALQSLTGFEKVLPLSTGSEAIEASIKMGIAWGTQIGRSVIVSFHGAFHGRTMGAQAVGGMSHQKTWIPLQPGSFFQVPYPDCRVPELCRFDTFLSALEAGGTRPSRVAAVVFEAYQGSTLAVADAAFVKDLEAWCRDQGVLLIADEVQAGFGRTGRLFGFEHFGIRPDVVCCGKAISGSLPLAAVLCRGDVADIFEPGDMSSTHTGSPVCLAAGIATIALFRDGGLLSHAARCGVVLQDGLRNLARRFPDLVDQPSGIGLVGGFTAKVTDKPDPTAARELVERAWRKGLLLFAPIGPHRALIKVSPPLISTEAHIADGLLVLAEILAELQG